MRVRDGVGYSYATKETYLDEWHEKQIEKFFIEDAKVSIGSPVFWDSINNRREDSIISKTKDTTYRRKIIQIKDTTYWYIIEKHKQWVTGSFLKTWEEDAGAYYQDTNGEMRSIKSKVIVSQLVDSIPNP